MSARLQISLPAPPREAVLWGSTAAALLAARRAALQEDARDEGREEGAQAALEGPVRVLDQAAQALATTLEEARAECARLAVELAVIIARGLLRTELDAGHHDIERIVRETLAHSGVGRGPCVIHLHPSDLERLRHVAFRSRTLLEPDEGVPVGNVHVSTPKGLLVNDLEACLEAAAERLRGALV